MPLFRHSGFTGHPRQFLTAALFFATFGLQLIIGLWLLPLDLPFDLPTLPLQIIGSCIAATGAWLPLWAFTHFRKADTAIAPFAKPSALVTTGPYRITRNPMYAGILLALLGFAIAINSLSAMLTALLFPLAISFLVIPWEEAKLYDIFGDDYLAYKKKTPRWMII